MSFGIYLKLGDGSVFDSTKETITFYEAFSIAGGSTGSKAYPELAGMSLDVVTLKQSSDSVENLSDTTISTALGYPVLSWAPVRAGAAASVQNLLVFVR